MTPLPVFTLLCTLVIRALASASRGALLPYPNKPRVFILSDISNEPDDQESLTRYLLYANQFQTEGIVATTSTWLRNATHPEAMLLVMNAYGNVTDSLNQHAPPGSPYPSGDEIRSLLRTGPAVYGMEAVGKNVTLSSGGELLLERLQAESDQPLWVLCWGGANVLAQVLYKIEETFSAAEAAALRSKLRVYTISDQDDTGAWIRHRYPEILYIASIHGWNQYGLASWSGISGEAYYGEDHGGPDPTKVSHEWLRENIQIGPYGKEAYPNYAYIMEGDTPTFLYLIQNGLGVSEQPDYGSWGGRYSKVNPSTILNFNAYGDAADRVVGANNETFISNLATIWRWRDAYQNDFAARMQWSLPSNVSRANHHPVISVNGSTSLTPLNITVSPGSTITLDASDTRDPDDDHLSFRWFQYKEPGTNDWNVAGSVPQLNISTTHDGSLVQVQIPLESESCNGRSSSPSGCWLLHLILEVTDDGYHPLTSYRRVLLQTAHNLRV
ncbi:putative cellulose-binding protein [Rosellinia necatrix]|uniref:Putative cellulose-binding protein n=1 Tax=Rosellinia necatrix TaxID=77044 RepID=A0A1W2TT17_ROSNE|nr:putative cellulose-binding protein [Rosellinia necatrix]